MEPEKEDERSKALDLKKETFQKRNRNKGIRGFVFRDTEFSGKTLDKLQDHPVYGPHVRQWLTEGRTDLRRMMANLKVIKERAKRQKLWLTHYEASGNEAVACEKAKVSYATFYGWKKDDRNFQTIFEGLREGHAIRYLNVARQTAMDPEKATDRWNLIKAEIPEYNPKTKQAVVNIDFSGDIDFAAKGAVPDKPEAIDVDPVEDFEVTAVENDGKEPMNETST